MMLTLDVLSAATSATYYADGIVSSAVNGDGDTITLTFDEVDRNECHGK